MTRHRGDRARPRRIAIAVGLIAVFTVATAAARETTATDRLREFFRAANHVLADPALAERPYERLGAIRLLVLDLVDFRAAASSALGPAWQARSAEERERFVGLFTELLQSSLLSRVRSRARLDGGLAITYAGEVKEPDGVTVHTELTTRTGDEITVGFVMARSGARWMVHDVVVEGVSLVANYRAQFQRVLQRESFTALVAEMRDRVDAVDAPVTPVLRQTAMAVPARTDVVAPVPAPAVDPAAPPMPVPAPVIASPASGPPPRPAGLPAVRAVVGAGSRRSPAPLAPAHGSAVALAVPPSALPLTPPVAAAPERQPATIRPATMAPRPEADELSFPPSPGPSPAVITSPAADPPAAATAVPARGVARKAPRPTTYWVQVGAYYGVAAATRAAAALRDHAVTLVTTPGPGPSPLLRVLLGPFARRADAVLTLRALKGRGVDGFLARGPE
jgi:phospholipid transport system substrate-binding protein